MAALIQFGLFDFILIQDIESKLIKLKPTKLNAANQSFYYNSISVIIVRITWLIDLLIEHIYCYNNFPSIHCRERMERNQLNE